MSPALDAPHFVDLEEAEGAPGAYSIKYHSNGSPRALTALCPCGCGLENTFELRQNSFDQDPKWVLISSETTGDSLYPTVEFRCEDVPGCHWRGMLYQGAWRRFEMPRREYQLRSTVRATTTPRIEPREASQGLHVVGANLAALEAKGCAASRVPMIEKVPPSIPSVSGFPGVFKMTKTPDLGS